MMSDPVRVLESIAGELDLKEAKRAGGRLQREEPGYTMGGSASERIEQLEAEVESWKNSYERSLKENGELAAKLAAIYESQRLHEELG